MWESSLKFKPSTHGSWRKLLVQKGISFGGNIFLKKVVAGRTSSLSCQSNTWKRQENCFVFLLFSCLVLSFSCQSNTDHIPPLPSLGLKISQDEEVLEKLTRGPNSIGKVVTVMLIIPSSKKEKKKDLFCFHDNPRSAHKFIRLAPIDAQVTRYYV